MKIVWWGQGDRGHLCKGVNGNLSREDRSPDRKGAPGKLKKEDKEGRASEEKVIS